MLLYDFEKIWLLSAGQSKLIVRYFKHLYFNKPEFTYLKGSNFMVNPLVVVNNPYKLANRLLAEYIGVCSLRNYANYQQLRDTDLEIDYFPDYIPKMIVENNPLLTIENTKIIFKKEKL